MSSPVMKGAGGGCLGCGCLLGLGGIACFVLVAAGAINSSEEGTVVVSGISNLFCGGIAALLGAVLLFLGFRKTDD